MSMQTLLLIQNSKSFHISNIAFENNSSKQSPCIRLHEPFVAISYSSNSSSISMFIVLLRIIYLLPFFLTWKLTFATAICEGDIFYPIHISDSSWKLGHCGSVDLFPDLLFNALVFIHKSMDMVTALTTNAWIKKCAF